MATTQEIKSLELNINQAKTMIEQGAALARLRNNRDFKLIIGNGYFELEAVRLVHLKADPSMQTKEHQEAVIKQIDAIGSLNMFFHSVNHRATVAQRAVEADEETLSELLVEEIQ
jgi:hypothetical protein